MKCISIWQPWASLIVHNHKFIETRGWPAPKSVIGQRIAIAATKIIRPEQRAAYEDEDFEQFYSETGLPELEDLPRGAILGTALLHSCEEITAETTDSLTTEELAFGWYTPGRYAWRLRQPILFDTPIIARGAQGLWEFDPHGLIIPQAEARARADQERAAAARRDHQVRQRANLLSGAPQGGRHPAKW